MIAVTDTLEQRLHTACARQLLHYERALDIVRQQANLPDIAAAGDRWVTELNETLEEVLTLDSACAADREIWRQSGRSAGPAFRTVLTRLADSIRTLHEHIDRYVAQVHARRQQLIPELDLVLRQREMLQAYRQSGRP